MPSNRRTVVDTASRSSRRNINPPPLSPPSTVITLACLIVVGSIAVAMDATTSSDAGGASGGDFVGIGLTPSDYFMIQSSECEDELRLGATTGTGGGGLASTWEGETARLWSEVDDAMDGDGDGDDVATWKTFVVCDSSPGASGYERKREVRTMLGGDGGLSESADSVARPALLGYDMSDFPLYNGDDMTCLLVRCDAVRARTLREAAEASASASRVAGATSGEESADDAGDADALTPRIKVQPLLPMMKVRKGTASACARAAAANAAAATEGGGGRRIQIAAAIGPGLLDGGGDGAVDAAAITREGLARNILGRIGTSGNLRLQLESAFPHTSTVVLARCEDSGGAADADETSRRRRELADADANADGDEWGGDAPGAGGVDQFLADAFDAVSSRASVRADGRGGWDTMYVEIDASSSSSDGDGGTGTTVVTELGLLSLVAGLAARDEVVSVEVVPTMRPW